MIILLTLGIIPSASTAVGSEFASKTAHVY